MHVGIYVTYRGSSAPYAVVYMCESVYWDARFCCDSSHVWSNKKDNFFGGRVWCLTVRRKEVSNWVKAHVMRRGDWGLSLLLCIYVKVLALRCKL